MNKERKPKRVMTFYGIENAPSAKEACAELHEVLFHFLECSVEDSFVWDNGVYHRSPVGTNGEAVSEVSGNILNEAILTAHKIRNKWPHLDPVPTKPHELLNWCTTSQLAEAPPNDLIALRVAIKDFDVSRSTLKERIGKGEIKSYRAINAKSNSPLKVSRAEIKEKYSHRQIIVKHKYPADK